MLLLLFGNHALVTDGQSLQDMDISPDRSTPLSENSYGTREPISTARSNSENNAVPPVVVLDNSNQTVRFEIKLLVE